MSDPYGALTEEHQSAVRALAEEAVARVEEIEMSPADVPHAFQVMIDALVWARDAAAHDVGFEAQCPT